MTTHHQGKEMTENNAAQAAEQDPLSDEYVNAVIRQHGYDSPETVIARLWQWIGLNGGENSVTLLMYEAHKALSKLRAEGVQAGDEEPPPIIPDDEEIAEPASTPAISTASHTTVRRLNAAIVPPWQAPL